jgi:hypothetical protein
MRYLTKVYGFGAKRSLYVVSKQTLGNGFGGLPLTMLRK